MSKLKNAERIQQVRSVSRQYSDASILQQKTEKLISSFSESELKTIERYFLSAIRIMQETTKNMNSKPIK
jgi:hypothetical protein